MKKLFNKKNPLFLLIICALLLVSTSIVPAKTAQAVTDEVSLYYIDQNYRGRGYYEDTVYVKVKNLAFEKDIDVYYTFSSDNGTWKKSKATFVKSLDSQTDIFKADINGFGNLKYYIKYTVNGAEYTDNNNNANYTDDCILGSAPIHAGKTHGNSVYATVKDFKDPNAKVEMLYTTDNCRTPQTKTLTKCEHQSNNDELTYECSLDFSDSTPGFKYYMSYTVNGTTYLDNNFGKDYDYSNHHSPY